MKKSVFGIKGFFCLIKERSSPSCALAVACKSESNPICVVNRFLKVKFRVVFETRK